MDITHVASITAPFFLLGLLFLLLSACGGSAALDSRSGEAAFVPCTVSRVIDGDTIAVSLDGAERKVRLIGIDAAESVHPDEARNTDEGLEASAHLKSTLHPGTQVWLQADTSDTDKYGRLLRYVWLSVPDAPVDFEEIQSKMLNAAIVRDGYAVAKRYEPDTMYADALEQIERGPR